MIVKRPIGPVKIGNQLYRLQVDRAVPGEVLEFWKSEKLIETFIKSGAIESETKTITRESNMETITDVEPIRKSEGSKPKNSKQGIFDSGDNRE